MDSGFVNRTRDGHRYVVFVPAVSPPEAGYPLILFLHSAGERGTDGQRQVDSGIGPSIRERAGTFPGIVVFPQVDFADGPILETWRAGEPGGQLARSILADVEEHWPVDPDRRAITGWSMGAYGALSLAADDPQTFSRVLAIAGGGETDWGAALNQLPAWLIHGERDAIVPVTESRRLADAIPAPHRHFRYTEVPAAGHDVWRSVYDNPTVLDWLLADGLAAPPDVAITAPPVDSGHGTVDSVERPFAPALVVSRAISLRLGNEALRVLADGVPHAMREEGVHGTLPPVEDRVEFEGRRYDVHFREMSYRGDLQRAFLEGQGSGRLRVAFALKNLEVRIGEIEVSDERDGVTVRDISVIIGHRDPVWMDLEVRPAAASDGSLRLDLLQSEFGIGDNNWFVDPPEDEQMTIRGDLFSAEVMRTAIVGGVYQRKAVIEEEILGAVETILAQVEQRADFSPLSRLVTALWPLPVYRPRLQVRLEEAVTDAEGVSLVFGCVVDGPTSSTSGPVPYVTASIPPAGEIEAVPGLEAAVAVDVVGHLSRLLAGTDAMSIYAADVPGRPFRELDDTAMMEETLAATSDAGGFSDLRSRLMLVRPFSYSPQTGPVDVPGGVRMAIDVPSLRLTVFGRQAATGEWTDVADRTLELQQPLQLQAIPQIDGPTRLALAWDPTTQIREVTDEDRQAELDPIVHSFEQGWSRWAGSQQQTMTLADVAVGSSTLRLEGFDWHSECLAARFRPAATVLVNPTDRLVVYCIRTDQSRWSSPQSLPPRTQHIYRNGVPLQVREADRWSRNGQVLNLETYEWSQRPDADGHRWIERKPLLTRSDQTSR